MYFSCFIWNCLRTVAWQKLSATLLVMSCVIGHASAKEYYWYIPGYGLDLHFSSLIEACNYDVKQSHNKPYPGFFSVYNSVSPYDPYMGFARCNFTGYTPEGHYWATYNNAVLRGGHSCMPGATYDPNNGTCVGSSAGKQKGADQANICTLESMQLNPVIGSVVQKEVDYETSGLGTLEFYRIYNSLDGEWRHSYSTHLRAGANGTVLVHADGREAFYAQNGKSSDETGNLISTATGWEYTGKDNKKLSFDQSGMLLKISDPLGANRKLTYFIPTSPAQRVITVTDDFGNEIKLKDDALYQPLEVVTNSATITYTYNINRRLVSVSKTHAFQTETRTYHYEDPNNGDLLTGVTDERGKRFLTWAYDDQGRTISSERAGGMGKTLVSYGLDGSSTVTSALGKQTVYRLHVIQGVNRIVAIEGEPTANCPASNSTFTYNDRGQVLTQTDAKGFITTYTYNDRGLETSRIEASGTPQARTTTTTWHATFNLPLTVTEGGQVTTYTYDTQGRQTSRTQTAL